MLFINRYCIIRNKSVFDSGKLIFSDRNASLDGFAESAFNSLSVDYPKFYKMDRLSRLGFLGAEVVLKERNIPGNYTSSEVALVLANAASSLDTDRRFFDSMKTIASPALFVYTLPNIVAGEICIRHKIQGENAFFIFEGFDAVQMAEYTAMVLATEKTTACLAGWVEVVGEQHDVFLYLVEKKNGAGGTVHSAEELQKIYTATYE